MYYKLKARSYSAFNASILDADMAGLDPDVFDKINLTYEIGTGNIEKVGRLISKHKLDILMETDYAPHSSVYSEKRNQVSDYRDGFEDGVKFAREVIIANIREWAEKSEDGQVMDYIADKIEFGQLNNDL